MGVTLMSRCAQIVFRMTCLAGLAVAAGCLYPGLPEMLRTYDFHADPDGDGSLATARPVAWWNDEAVVAGGLALDPANLLLIQSYLGSQIVGQNLTPASEVDVFALGWLDAGDQISVSVDSLVQALVNFTPLAQADIVRNAAAASLMLVDADSQIVGWPAAAPIAVDQAGEFWLVVQSIVPSDYTLHIRRLRNQPAPPSRRGVLLLRFDGAEDLNTTFVTNNGKLIPVTDLPPFDLDQARPDFAGQSQRFKNMLRELIEYVYARWDVLVTLDPAEAEAVGHYDTIVFTTPSPNELGFDSTDAQMLGTEPTLDVEDRSGQVGIVFIAAFKQGQYLDFNSYAAFWASVAAHEYGHALGLWHVRQDSECLMVPEAGGPGEPRRIRNLVAAQRKEAGNIPVIYLVQNPDRYLSRVLGRRDPEQVSAVVDRARLIFPELPSP